MFNITNSTSQINNYSFTDDLFTDDDEPEIEANLKESTLTSSNHYCYCRACWGQQATLPLYQAPMNFSLSRTLPQRQVPINFFLSPKETLPQYQAPRNFSLSPKETLPQSQAPMGFSLNHIKYIRYREKDQTGIAEDFNRTKYTETQIAQRHTWKRLNFFLIMSDYIKEKAPFLVDFDFPLNAIWQFAPEASFVPPSFMKVASRNSDFECGHIGVLNKIVVKHEKKLFVLNGPLKISAIQTSTSLQRFFSLCDIVPKLVNSIDWYLECCLRIEAYKLLRMVKNGKQSPTEASHIFAARYGYYLIELLDKIRDQNKKMVKNCSLNTRSEADKLRMEAIFADKNKSSQYINGMLEAVIHFRTHFPSLKEFWKFSAEYRLYKKL